MSEGCQFQKFVEVLWTGSPFHVSRDQKLRISSVDRGPSICQTFEGTVSREDPAVWATKDTLVLSTPV